MLNLVVHVSTKMVFQVFQLLFQNNLGIQKMLNNQSPISWGVFDCSMQRWSWAHSSSGSSLGWSLQPTLKAQFKPWFEAVARSCDLKLWLGALSPLFEGLEVSKNCGLGLNMRLDLRLVLTTGSFLPISGLMWCDVNWHFEAILSAAATQCEEFWPRLFCVSCSSSDRKH